MSQRTEKLEPETFVDAIASLHGLSHDSLLVRYLRHKTKAAKRGSKARRSLGNMYALLVIAEDFVAGRSNGSRFGDLLARMRKLPFGSKLQNHPLDNRLNDEFKRQMDVDDDLLPVQAVFADGQKTRRISPVLLTHDGVPPEKAAAFIVEAICRYVRFITENQTAHLNEIEAIKDMKGLIKFLDSAFSSSSDARLFEIASYALLAEHFRSRLVWIGPDKDDVQQEPLLLFRSGRTNANDGGIDFVLRPLGHFFQVTESFDFGKYFLDFEKVNRFPLSFVIKTEQKAEEAKERIRAEAIRSRAYTEAEINTYMNLFEEIYTLPDLRSILTALPDDERSMLRIKDELALQFRLEYGLLD